MCRRSTFTLVALGLLAVGLVTADDKQADKAATKPSGRKEAHPPSPGLWRTGKAPKNADWFCAFLSLFAAKLP